MSGPLKDLDISQDPYEITGDEYVSYIRSGNVKYYQKTAIISAVQVHFPFKVETLEGTMKGKKGDYLVCGIKGELYPVDRMIFEATYEEVIP